MEDVEEALRAALLLALAGDNEAYVAFLTRSGAHLRSYFRRRLAASPFDVEDLVQETLLAVHNRRHTFEPAARQERHVGSVVASQRQLQRGPQRFFDVFQRCPAIRSPRGRGYTPRYKKCPVVT